MLKAGERARGWDGRLTVDAGAVLSPVYAFQGALDVGQLRGFVFVHGVLGLSFGTQLGVVAGGGVMLLSGDFGSADHASALIGLACQQLGALRQQSRAQVGRSV